MSRTTSLSVVVPCYNEEAGIPQLKARLTPLMERLRQRYELETVFVDDGSKDQTYARLQEAFGSLPGVKIVQHDRNRNLGAAMRTGVTESKGEWIAMLDSDCTYDPSLLEPLLALMGEGADLVTVSPYHPQGKVEGVPRYRLFLSLSLTALYRMILRKRIYTFTALMRVFRRSIYSRIASPLDDFSALAEMMLKSLAQDLVVKEAPAVLTVRRFGESKMKTMRVIRAHLRLLRRLVFSPSTFRS
jgi:dolichol-phosphate mannosyltransferase